MTALPTLQPDWLVSTRVRVHATTRLGGVSAPPFDSLNLGRASGDDPAAVATNRRRVANALALPGEPRWLRQVHGADVFEIDAEPAGARRRTESPRPDTDAPVADAAVSSMPGAVLVVSTADCLPVAIATGDGSRVGVAHAGWRGLAGGVLEALVAHFPQTADLHAWLGPAIGPTAFEVGEDVREAFLDRVSGDTDRKRRVESAFVRRSTPGKYLADLYALARLALSGARPIRVTGGEHCTFSDATRFHSYRRDGARSGRLATFAWIEPR